MEKNMGKIFYLMGKSASGKDTLYRRLMEELPLRTIVPYTTRPLREGEENGREYHFVGEAGLARLRAQGRVIECRTYQTVHGPWSYFTVDDGQVNLAQASYLVIGTLESYIKMQQYYGSEALVPIYIYVEDGERLQRALNRERLQSVPRYAELCRRFLADEEDFSGDKLRNAGITRSYSNQDAECCLKNIKETMKIECEV